MAALDQFNYSEALLRPVKVTQFGVFSPEQIVSSVGPCLCEYWEVLDCQRQLEPSTEFPTPTTLNFCVHV